MDGIQFPEAESGLVSITVLSVTLRAGKLFALAAVEIDGVRLVEVHGNPPHWGTKGKNSRRTAMPQANLRVLPDEVHRPIGEAVVEAPIERCLTKRRFAVPIPD
jgi:hypothetical protein